MFHYDGPVGHCRIVESLSLGGASIETYDLNNPLEESPNISTGGSGLKAQQRFFEARNYSLQRCR